MKLIFFLLQMGICLSLLAESYYPRQSYPLFLVDDDQLYASVDRFGTIQVCRGDYLFAPQFWDGVSTGMAIRKKDLNVVFLNREGGVSFVVPSEWYTVKNPLVTTMFDFSEGHLLCWQTTHPKSVVFVNHQGQRSKTYMVLPGWKTSFVNGLATVFREGNWYLLNHNYEEIFICSERQGNLYPFHSGLYAILHLKRPNPEPNNWPWPYDTIAVINRRGEILLRFPLITKNNFYPIQFLLSSKGCLIPILESGSIRYRYYLFSERRFLEDFSCVRVEERGFSDDAVFVEDEQGLIILEADGQWIRLEGNAYVAVTATEWPVTGHFHHGFACLRRKDGSRCFVNKKGQVVKEVSDRIGVSLFPDFPLWHLSDSILNPGFFLDKNLKEIIREDGSPVLRPSASGRDQSK